ncbi:MAG: gamma-glutamyl-gamma-aminobutyrate hydrolase family protein [Chloroflexi bacterium]|nr:gamma-glutamyl-gamma-aminobutyrate hydrolase family protein [Chloroflexota bacterium]
MRPPLIGITVHPKTAPDRDDLDTLLEGIIAGVERAGGLPLLIPLGLDEATLRDLYARLDGLLLSGGGDIEPGRYGATMHESMGGVDAERDRAEFALAQWIVNDPARKPLFGICRGLQVINVALGGTLYRDIGEYPNAIRHTFSAPDYPNDYLPHEVKIDEDSTLARVIGQPILRVNSLHHQACRDVAPGLRVSAVAPDGLVEAIEIPHHPFALTVQWHPECLPAAPEMRALFEAFVAASGRA